MFTAKLVLPALAVSKTSPPQQQAVEHENSEEENSAEKSPFNSVKTEIANLQSFSYAFVIFQWQAVKYRQARKYDPVKQFSAVPTPPPWS